MNKDKKLFLFTFDKCLFLPFTATYRDMYFRDIVGQEPLKNRLVQTVNENRLSHAWFFFGPEGSGILPLALAFARYILCTARTPADSCGTCPSCIKLNKFIHPDLHFTYPVNKTKSVDKDLIVSEDFIADWRSFLLRQPYGRLTQWYDSIDLENKQGIINLEESKRLSARLNLKSFESEYKVAILWQPEKMNDQAGNKLLKLLEEPPPLTVFILAGENPEQMLTTIRSRCVQVKVPRITDPDLKQVLMTRQGMTEEKATNLVKLVSGNYLRARELMAEEEDSEFNYTRFTVLMRLCFQKKIPELIRSSEELASLTREKQKSFLEYGLRVVRECMALHFNTPDIVYISDNERKFVTDFAPFITGGNILLIREELSSAIGDIERNGNGRIIFLDMVLKISSLIRK
jgi:DNA polymerase III subunit delta'